MRKLFFTALLVFAVGCMSSRPPTDEERDRLLTSVALGDTTDGTRILLFGPTERIEIRGSRATVRHWVQNEYNQDATCRMCAEFEFVSNKWSMLSHNVDLPWWWSFAHQAPPKTFVRGTNVETIVGVVSSIPINDVLLGSPTSEWPGNFYFDIVDRTGSTNEILIRHPAKMPVPTDRTRKCELKCTVDRIPFKAGEIQRAGDDNERFHLMEWRYLQEGHSQPPPPN